MSDKILFWAGVAVSGAAVIGLAVSVVIYRFRRLKLSAEYDKEYGAEEKVQ